MIKFLALLLIAFVAAKDHSEKELLSEINHSQHLWKAAPNHITEKGIEYMTRLLGAKLRENSKEGLGLPIVYDVAESIPDSFDSRAKWPKCPSISAIKNQGQCGSCWAVAAAAAISDRLCIKSNFKVKVNISAENLLCCCSNCVDPGTRGCDGGYPEQAWDYFMKVGLVTGGDFHTNDGCQPYEISPDYFDSYTPPCVKRCTNKKYKKSYWKDRHYGKTSYQLDESESVIQTDIMKNGPVEAGFSVYRDFYYYTSGVYIRSSSQKLGGHAVRIIGWGVEKGVKYWLIANSWGREWGENGTFKIRRGTNECGIESYITAGLIKKSI